ncbi:MAG: hypothetical protein KDD48_00140 [Bdellovibrionales bacterium]|nr:hypothetical protein [Bdellovibrionales bacterium]
MFLRKKPEARRVFVLGAGFSHHFSKCQYPLSKTLLEAFVAKYKSDYENKLVGFASEDLEKSLTFLALSLTSSESETLKRRFCTFSREHLLTTPPQNIENNALSEIQRIFRPLDIIISFNYDIFVERLLWKAGLWSPKGGYGLDGNPSSWLIDKVSERLPKVENNISLIKPHGSLNFINKTPIDSSTKDLEIVVSDNYFPECRSNMGEISSEDAYVIVPDYLKDYGNRRSMIHFWHDAFSAIQQAENLVIFGYSLPESDTLAKVMFSFLTRKLGRKLKLFVINKTADEANYVGERIYDLAMCGPNDLDKCFMSSNSAWLAKLNH